MSVTSYVFKTSFCEQANTFGEVLEQVYLFTKGKYSGKCEVCCSTEAILKGSVELKGASSHLHRSDRALAFKERYSKYLQLGRI